MPQLCTIIECPISTGDFTKLSTSGLSATTDKLFPSGEVEVYFRNDNATAINVVFGVDNLTDAATELGAFRYITVPGSSTVLIPFRLDPSKTWIRSSGAAHNSLFAIVKW
jgi:hypothetical protein